VEVKVQREEEMEEEDVVEERRDEEEQEVEKSLPYKQFTANISGQNGNVTKGTYEKTLCFFWKIPRNFKKISRKFPEISKKVKFLQ